MSDTAGRAYWVGQIIDRLTTYASLAISLLESDRFWLRERDNQRDVSLAIWEKAITGDPLYFFVETLAKVPSSIVRILDDDSARSFSTVAGTIGNAHHAGVRHGC